MDSKNVQQPRQTEHLIEALPSDAGCNLVVMFANSKPDEAPARKELAINHDEVKAFLSDFVVEVGRPKYSLRHGPLRAAILDQVDLSSSTVDYIAALTTPGGEEVWEKPEGGVRMMATLAGFLRVASRIATRPSTAVIVYRTDGFSLREYFPVK